MTGALSERIGMLARRAAATATSPEAARDLGEVADRVEGPLRVAIAGKVKAGKSTLLNAIIGEELAPTDAGECTRIVTWYRFSERPFARVHPRVGEAEERPYARDGGALRVDLGSRSAQDLERLEIGWPTGRLRDLVLIDTPGIASLSREVSARTHAALASEGGRAPVADAVLYLLRHTHGADLRFLEAFHDNDVAEGTPVNTIGVLSRADEIGSSRLDAMEVADRVAKRYQAEARLHRLCPVVLPVNGLLGHAASALTEAEFAALGAIASAGPEVVAELLLTADRLVAGRPGVGIDEQKRLGLLDRLGLFGVRLGVELLRAGTVSNAPELCARLAEMSGLERLRRVLHDQFEDRARVLQTRSAVSHLRDALGRGASGDAAELLRELEEVTAGAHEFEEVRVLLELRSGDLALAAERTAELDLLMGGSGYDPASRLGLPPGADADAVKSAATAALARWQQVESHPLSSRPVQLAARVATRTLEGLIVAATPA